MGLLVQLLLLGDKAWWGVSPRRGHESLRPLLPGGRRAGVHGDVLWQRVHVHRPWWGTPAVVGGGAAGSHDGVAVLAATTAVAAVVVPILVVVAAVTIVGAIVVVLARRARRRQWSGRCFVGVERCRSSSWTGGVQVDFLHHGICLDVEVGNDGVDVRQRSGRGLRGRGRRGSRDQLLGGSLPFEIGSGSLLLIKELTAAKMR
jgi:hypothetical protein